MARKMIRGLAAVVIAWTVLAIATGILLSNPFTEAREAAAEIGGWESEDVAFLEGHYGFRFFYTQVRAELEASEEGICQPVEIELRHVPFRGWRVVAFAAGEARPAESS